jgi:hypothetical protein
MIGAPMEPRAKVTKEVLCEESRFILANVRTDAKLGSSCGLDALRQACEGEVSVPLAEYLAFLEQAGYITIDLQRVWLTPEGDDVVNGLRLTELTERAVAHFRRLRQTRTQAATMPPVGAGGSGPAIAAPALAAGTLPNPGPSLTPAPSPLPPPPVSAAAPLPSPPVAPTSAAAGRELGGHAVTTVRRHPVSATDLEARYERGASLGTGGIGAVYCARQTALGRDVAMKEIRELFGFFSDDQRSEIVRRFADVVKAQAAVQHPHVIAIHDLVVGGEHPYVVTELATGGSLRRLIADAEEVPTALVFRYLLQTLHALRAAHRRELYHRGLKPEQLLLDGSGALKVSDFGFARIVERDQAVIRQVYVGMGNVAYLAPELYTDPSAAGAQADIYATGIICYELLTRKLPGRRSPMPSKVNPAVPAGFDDIFDRMTRDGLDERYPDVDAILAELDRLPELAGLLGNPSLALPAEELLATVKFRRRADDAASAGGAAGGGDAGADAGDSEPTDGGDGKGYRPYSMRQKK